MLEGLFIFCEDDFASPIHAEPDVADVDPDLWVAVCERVNDALEGDRRPAGRDAVGELVVGWRVRLRVGVSFVAVVTDAVSKADLNTFLRDVARAYLDEVDDPCRPGPGVEDVLVDVIPPWED